MPPQEYLDHVVLPKIFLFPSAIWKDFVQIWEPVIDNYSALGRGMSLRDSGRFGSAGSSSRERINQLNHKC